MHTILNIKDAELSLSTVGYGDAILNANIGVEQADVDWRPISGADQSEVEKGIFTLNLEFGQDLSANTTLTGVLWNGQGTKVPFVLTPKNGDTPKVEGTVTLKYPSQVGGGRGIATATVALRIDGTPTITWGAGE